MLLEPIVAIAPGKMRFQRIFVLRIALDEIAEGDRRIQPVLLPVKAAGGIEKNSCPPALLSTLLLSTLLGVLGENLGGSEKNQQQTQHPAHSGRTADLRTANSLHPFELLLFTALLYLRVSTRKRLIFSHNDVQFQSFEAMRPPADGRNLSAHLSALV